MELNPYASYLNGQDPIPVLTSTAQRLQTLTARLTGAQVNTPPAPRKWSICNIVTHLADCEIVFSFRLRQTLAAPLDRLSRTAQGCPGTKMTVRRVVCTTLDPYWPGLAWA